MRYHGDPSGHPGGSSEYGLPCEAFRDLRKTQHTHTLEKLCLSAGLGWRLGIHPEELDEMAMEKKG